MVALVSSIAGLAQLDYTHWLPPMHSRDGNQVTDHYLYLSTPSPTPIVVTITDGAGTILATPTISAGVSFTYEVAPDDPSIIMLDDTDLNTVLSDKGIIASADEKFYCNFRARSNLQATSITCKGNAARGQTFRFGAMPQVFEHYMRNFVIGIMATEDNTTVTISDYDAGVEFFDVAGNITDDALVFILDSGQCYIASGYNNIPANLTGFVGALISSDRPIVMNNGNWCGSICDAGGQDIGMDQSVPVEVIGDEYILIRGDGDEQMERPLIIAHTDGTQIYVNELPEALITINAGEYYLVPEPFYTGGGHENMYIQTSEPAYVYQPLGGSTSRATPGMNFIPPVSCKMTKEINLIPSIDQIGGTTYNGAIICFTLAGAEVTVNGIVQGGAELVDGAPEWETYKITGFTGDVEITSTDRMAAGMFGFNGEAGFAGFYSGFDQIGFADFSFTENCESFPVEFTDETVTFSETIIGWDWDFGDAETSIDENPDHIYLDGGTYDVLLEVTTNLGCTDTVYYPVIVRDAPIADFTMPSTCFGETSAFTDASLFDEGIITDWDWDLGDLTLSEETNPLHIYTEYGAYTVALTVTGENGCESIFTDDISISPNPIADFSSIDDCFYNSSLFTNLSTIPEGTIEAYTWDFGDGTGPSVLTDPSHLYAGHGTYDVTLSALSLYGCSSDTTITITRFAAPETDFDIADLCINETLVPFNTSTIVDPYSITSYNWDFGDGTTAALEDPNHDYTAPGIYEVKLITSSENGCLDSIVHTIHIFDEPIANFSVLDGCIYDLAVFTNLSTVTDGDLTAFNWTYGDGTGSGIESPTHNYLDAGTYNVTLEVTSEHGCISDTTLALEQFAAPEVLFSVENACLYDSLTFINSSEIEAPYLIDNYNWLFGDGHASTESDPSHLFDEPGTFTIILSATSENGCTTELSYPVTVHPVPEVNFNADPVCANEGPTAFNNTSSILSGAIASWEWTFPDATTSAIENPTKYFDASGEYLVKLFATSDFGCSDSIEAPILIRALPFAEFVSNDDVICGNECVIFNSTSFSLDASINSLEWSSSFGHEGYGETIELCFENYDDVESYFDMQLIATDNFGCSDTLLAEDYIKILPTPKASFFTNPDEIDLLDPEVRFTNTSMYASHYVWDFGDSSPNSNEEDPTHLYSTEPEVYEIILYAYNNIEMECSDTATKTIKILDQLIYYVPNAFSPDGDSYNNTFSPVFTSGFDPYNYHLSIFNRWGEVLFESNNAELGWNGAHGNKGLVQDGIYIWKIDFKETSSGRTIQDAGHVTLLK